ncbi:hypothetical protein J0895_17245 [Phormidium pseudopriestleyi FRX01]|uniref:Uncharacterized protein n=1 Tax=Phormidium pseudopriestleyi FRX01 TaxID=1759528 RepID=A0ABS3FUK9_9CYAN|nr:hypothetical protein [Phormidium pseudopriestleyi]MBO0350804.1 hypothetical protein [Phormidium pseudopriestleyi FRX01]
MFNHSIRKMLAVALVSVPVIWSGGTYTAQAQDAADVEFTLTNNTGRDLTHFYIAPTESDDYGPDILLDGVIGPGESSTVTIQDGISTCSYDLWATFGPGDGVGVGDVYQTNVNVCELPEYTYSN